jgi:hypothetical protein
MPIICWVTVERVQQHRNILQPPQMLCCKLRTWQQAIQQTLLQMRMVAL